MNKPVLSDTLKCYFWITVGSILYGFAFGSIVYWISEFLHWCWTNFKKHREKKRQAAKQPEE